MMAPAPEMVYVDHAHPRYGKRSVVKIRKSERTRSEGPLKAGRRLVLAGLALAAAFGSPIGALAQDAATTAAMTEERVRALVLDTIRQNPGIIAEAAQLLQEQSEKEKLTRAQETLERERTRLEQDPNAPVLGNPDGDVTVVEFFDYNCPYCKRVVGDVKALLKQDPGVRLVYREWPILGEGSLFAARAALAAREQDAYEEMHWALMDLPRAEEASVLQAAQELGLDLDRLREDMGAPEIDEHIRTSFELTEGLGFSGTPAFVVGDELVPGAVPLETLQSSVDRTRAASDKP